MRLLSSQKLIILGIPFSTKEGVRVKGLRHTYGSPIRQHVRAKNDADAVKLLRRVSTFAKYTCMFDAMLSFQFLEMANV